MNYTEYLIDQEQKEWEEKFRKGLLISGGLLLGGLGVSYLVDPDFFRAGFFGGNEIDPGITIKGFTSRADQDAILNGVNVFNAFNLGYQFGADNPLTIETAPSNYLSFQTRDFKNRIGGFVYEGDTDLAYIANDTDVEDMVTSHELLHLSQYKGPADQFEQNEYISHSRNPLAPSIIGVKGGEVYFEDGTRSEMFEEFIEFENADYYGDVYVDNLDGDLFVDFVTPSTSSYVFPMERFYNGFVSMLQKNGFYDFKKSDEDYLTTLNKHFDPDDFGDVFVKATRTQNGFESVVDSLYEEFIDPYNPDTIEQEAKDTISDFLIERLLVEDMFIG